MMSDIFLHFMSYVLMSNQQNKLLYCKYSFPLLCRATVKISAESSAEMIILYNRFQVWFLKHFVARQSQRKSNQEWRNTEAENRRHLIPRPQIFSIRRPRPLALLQQEA